MVFQKGNPGRVKGSKNKKTTEWERFSNWFMEDNLKQLREDLKELSPKDRVFLTKEMLAYFKPRLKQSDDSLTINASVVHTIEGLVSDSRQIVDVKEVEAKQLK